MAKGTSERAAIIFAAMRTGSQIRLVAAMDRDANWDEANRLIKGAAAVAVADDLTGAELLAMIKAAAIGSEMMKVEDDDAIRQLGSAFGAGLALGMAIHARRLAKVTRGDTSIEAHNLTLEPGDGPVSNGAKAQPWYKPEWEVRIP